MKHIDFNQDHLIIVYFSPQLTAGRQGGDEQSVKVALNAGRNVYIGKRPVYEVKMTNPVSIKSFQDLFIKKAEEVEIFRRFCRDYALKTKADIDAMMEEKERLEYLKRWEFIGDGLYNIY